MNSVEKETAESFYGTGERDHQLMLRYDGEEDVVCLPEDIARRSRRGMATGRMRGKHRRRDPSKQKALCRKRQRAFCLAEQVGFEPTGLERLTDFESASL